MTILVHQAQQNARIAIAAKNKTDVANIAAPVSVEIAADRDE